MSSTPSNPASGWDNLRPLEHLSISSVVTFARCARLWFYSGGCRLAPPVDHPALTFGGAVGAGMAELTTGDPSTAQERAFAQFKEIWRDGDEVHQDEKRNCYNASRIFEHYRSSGGTGGGMYQLVEPPKSLLKSGPGKSPWEIPFAMYLRGIPVPFVGWIDGLVREPTTGRLYALERKTTSEGSWMLAENFRMNPQSLGYPYFLKHMGLDVQGTIMEFISVPNPGKTARAHPKYEVFTVPIPTNDSWLRIFETWLVWKASQLIQCLREKWFPMELTGCAPYSLFGRSGFPCKFMNLCESEAGSGSWDHLKDLYVVREHKVFELPAKLTLEGKEIEL